MTAENVARALHGRRSGGGWACLCPAHESDGRPHTPSLSLAERGDTLLVHCHAGCPQADVISALRARGLWPERARPDHPPEWGRIVCTYDYTDEDGRLLYQVCRFEPKSFRPRRPDGAGGWRWGYGNVRRVLYRLPEVLEASIVAITEGEKDTETLRAWGFSATTNSGGANGWLPEFNQYFRGREAVIFPDADLPGLRRAAQIARGLIGIAARIQIVELEGVKDISEWFALGHSECELLAMLEGCDGV